MIASDLILRPSHLAGETILVTGGGSGLGSAMAAAFAALGAQVYIVGRRGAVLDATAKLIDASSGASKRVRPLVCDIRHPDSIEQVLEQVWNDGPLTGLINNAAGNFISPTEQLSPRAFDAITDIVFKGTFYITNAVGRRWLERGSSGSVVSILATWIWNGSPYTVPSTMSKAGLHAMTQSLAVEWGNRGIRLNAIAPGLFPTEGAWKRLWPGEEAAKPESPMGRVGDLRELCNLAAFLIGPGIDFLTGQTIAIDGAAHQAMGANFSHLSAWTDDQWKAAKESIRVKEKEDQALRKSSTMHPL